MLLRPCPCRKPHPAWSRSMLVLVKETAESVGSMDVEAGVFVRIGDRFGERVQRAGVRDALVRPVRVVELLELRRAWRRCRWFQIRVRSSSSRGHHAWVIASRARVVDIGEAADIPRFVAHWLRPARMTLSARSRSRSPASTGASLHAARILDRQDFETALHIQGIDYRARSAEGRAAKESDGGSTA